MTRITPDTRSAYAHFQAIATRWADNDIYGHVNNSVYYFYFDTVVNQWLIEAGLLELGQSKTIGLVVETKCNFFAPITFPQTVHAGLRIAKIGSSSVTYEIGLFADDETQTAARGHFVHVYVDEKTRRPVKISDRMREKLGELEVKS
ncbi:MAG: thioesterase family protein [Pseudomonadota bacterium]